MYDDTLTPEGKTCLELYFQSPWDIWQDLSDDEYAQEKEAVEKRCTELVEEHYPGIIEHIQVVDLATPRTTTKYTGVWKGSYEGFEPPLDMLGKNLPMELEGLEHFSMVGQWVMPGGGLPPSAQSGRWAIQKLAKKDKKSFKHYVPT
jgi:phytoene dehydrogenase-like protein